MGNAVAADGTLAIQCQSCHGSMSRVGAGTRQGWLDEPACQSCHTGTATHNNGQIRYTTVFDANGQPRVAMDQTFATNPNTPASGHLALSLLDGSRRPPVRGVSRLDARGVPELARQRQRPERWRQGHVGTLVECAPATAASPATVNGGPHGMHPVGQSWVSAHGDAVEGGNASLADCAVCHGADYRGTVLSRAASDRTLTTSFGTRPLWRGFPSGATTATTGRRARTRTRTTRPQRRTGRPRSRPTRPRRSRSSPPTPTVTR